MVVGLLALPVLGLGNYTLIVIVLIFVNIVEV